MSAALTAPRTAAPRRVVSRRRIGATVAILVLCALRPAEAQWRVEPLLGLRFGPPLKAGVAFATTYGSSAGAAQFSGLIVIAEPGHGGARASLGYLWAEPFASGLTMLGSVIRTWGSPAQVPPNRTLAGVEVRAMFFIVNVGVGVFQPVDGFGDDRRTRYFLYGGLGI